jgi:dihydrofolate synthase/folylpolyglutamate synthase
MRSRRYGCSVQRATAVVLEVGLGGRLDATNIIDADVAVILFNGFDHATGWATRSGHRRGESRHLRAGRPVVLCSADCPDSVRGARASVARRTWRSDFTWAWALTDRGRIATPAVRASSCRRPRSRVRSSTATRPPLAALRLLPGVAPAAHGQLALALPLGASRRPAAGHPGPVEWLLDVAHNEPAAAVLAAELRARPAPGRTLGVVGMLGDKDVRAVATILDPLIDQWIFCSITDEPRGLTAAALRARAGTLRGAGELAPTVAAGCERVGALARPGDRVVVFGSFHAVGPALEWLRLY